MSLVLLRPKAGGGSAPATTLSDLLPTIHARIGWRGVLTTLAWDGSSTSGWVTAGTAISGDVSSLSSTDSDSFGGGSSLEMVTQGTAASGIDLAIPGTAVSGREYRFRVGLRSVSGSTSTVLRAGNAADSASSTATITTGWAWYTVDWTPSADRTDAYVSIQNGAAATQTTRLDHAEFYEADSDVILSALTVTRGSRYDGTRERPGRITASVLDPDEVYTPRNSASPLTGAVEPGVPIHVRAIFGGRLYALAYGRVKTITPRPDDRTVDVSAEDGLAILDDYTIERGFSTDKAAYTCRAEALADEALAADQHDLATDSLEASPIVDGIDGERSLLDYLEDLNEATATLHVAVPYVEAVRPWRYKTMTRTTLTDLRSGQAISDDFQRISGIDLRDESLVTRQSIGWRGYERRPSQVVVEATAAVPYWTYADEEYGSTDSPEPAGIFRLKFTRDRKQRRKRKRKRVGTRWVDAVVPIDLDTDESVDVIVDWKSPMQDISVSVTDGGNVTSTVASEPGRTTITLTASAADTVSAISITAIPHLALDEDEETVDTTGALIVREGRPRDLEQLGSAGAANGLADYWTWRYGDARLRPQVVLQHQMSRQLVLDVGTRVTLTASRWKIDADAYIVRSIEQRMTRGGAEYETTLGLEELPTNTTGWVTLDGGSGLGLDSSAVLAH